MSFSLGSECIREFLKMQNCFMQYPKLYSNNNDSNQSNEKANELELNRN